MVEPVQEETVLVGKDNRASPLSTSEVIQRSPDTGQTGLTPRIEPPHQQLLPRPRRTAFSTNSYGGQSAGPWEDLQQSGPGASGGNGADPRGSPFRRFREQTYDVFRPQPTLSGAIGVLSLLFALGLGLGMPLLLASLGVTEIRVRYDNAAPFDGDSGVEPQAALWAAGDAGVRQSLILTVPHTMRPPIFLMYEVEGLYGNHKRYVRSVSWEQLSGKEKTSASSLDICKPRLYLGGSSNSSLPDSGLINPCGLRATSFFNDTFTLEADITTCGSAAATAVASRVDDGSGGSGWVGGSGAKGSGRRTGSRRFLQQLSSPLQPSPRKREWRRPLSAAPVGRDWFAPMALDQHEITWPLEARYLYGMYNSTNLNSVPAFRTGGSLDEPVGFAGHFQVWMRPSARPSSLKVYGVLNQQLPAGCVLRLGVANRYNTYGWGGAKRVVLSTQSWYGMRSLVLPCVMMVVAAGALLGAGLLLGLAFCLKRHG